MVRRKDRRILLGDNTSSGAVVLWPIRYQCAGVRMSAGLTSTHTHTHTRVCLWMTYVYSFAICAKFHLRRTIRNVTTAWVGECPCRPSGICDRHCCTLTGFSSVYICYLLVFIFPPMLRVHFYHNQCYIVQTVTENNSKEKRPIKLHLAPFGCTPRFRIAAVITCSAPASPECRQMG
jgi:hypothetical protein